MKFTNRLYTLLIEQNATNKSRSALYKLLVPGYLEKKAIQQHQDKDPKWKKTAKKVVDIETKKTQKQITSGKT